MWMIPKGTSPWVGRHKAVNGRETEGSSGTRKGVLPHDATRVGHTAGDRT